VERRPSPEARAADSVASRREVALRKESRRVAIEAGCDERRRELSRRSRRGQPAGSPGGSPSGGGGMISRSFFSSSSTRAFSRWFSRRVAASWLFSREISLRSFFASASSSEEYQ
jgi:hypothetical protein